MKIRFKICTAVAAFAFLVIVLVTAAEAAIYSDFHYYQKEYQKYGVLRELDMRMEDVMKVTNEMMDYLCDKRSDLEVDTVVGGEQREFFNAREKAHMRDVKKLFLSALYMRRVACFVFAVAVACLIFRKEAWMRLFALCYMAETTVLFLAAGILGYLFTKDFNRCFVKFHELFFDNDLWLLDPDTDLMIRMLPEGFFADFTVRIAGFLVAAAVTVFVFCAVVYRREKKKIRKTYQ